MATKNQSLKKIPVSQLKLGMFIHELCGSWMEHPFSKTRFKLNSLADLEALKKSSVSQVIIDPAQGLDCESKTAPKSAESVEEELRIVAEQAPDKASNVELAVEVARAAAVCSKAKIAVTAMFGEARMGQAVDASHLDDLVEEISGSVMRNPGALISLARLKTQDDYTYMHSVAVCGLMIALARQLGLDEATTRELGLAGMVHDIGKAKVDQDILNKPGKLTDDEFTHMKSHPVAGHALLVEGGSVGDIALDVCLHHHEKVDGTGYPDKLKAKQLSLFAKMGAVCDVYDAITSDRPYKAGWDPATAVRKMNEWSKGHFDDAIFQAFVKTVGIYPIGSLVRLESGLLGVVCDSNPDQLLTPMVKTFYCSRREMPVAIQVVNLADSSVSDKIASWENPQEWNFPHLEELWAGEAARKKRASVA